MSVNRQILGDTELQSEVLESNAAAQNYHHWLCSMAQPYLGDDPLEIGSGLGLSALDEPYDENHHGSFLPEDDEITARVRDALRADSSTWFHADRIRVATRGGVVTLSGLVDDLIDSDNLVAVADYVAGVVEVVDNLRVRRLMG